MTSEPSPPRSIEVVTLPGLTAYEDAYALQLQRRNNVENGLAGNALFLLEHTPVITLGRNAQERNLLLPRDAYAARGIALAAADRGGDVTYHGPGQLVAYPVLDLRQWRQALRWYLRCLEEVIIRVLAKYGIQGTRVDGLTGVWAGEAKVAAIGVGVHNWVTFHGIALNVAPDMEHFGLIVPCGIAGKPVTSLARLLDAPPAFSQVQCDFRTVFLDHFLNY